MIHEYCSLIPCNFSHPPPPRHTYNAFSFLSNQNLKKKNLLINRNMSQFPKFKFENVSWYSCYIWYNKFNLPISISEFLLNE